MNPDFGGDLIAGLNELRAARTKGDKLAIEAAGHKLDKHVGSMEKLFRFLDERRRQVRPLWTVEQIIEWIQRESQRPSRWSIATWGMMSEDFEFEALRQWLDQVGEGVKFREPNRVPWNESDPTYYPNKEAITDGHKAGTDHEIEGLRSLNPDKLNKLLRSRHGRMIRFMSRRRAPCRGKVHRDDWQKYLQWRITEHTGFAEAIEEAVKKLEHDGPPTRG